MGCDGRIGGKDDHQCVAGACCSRVRVMGKGLPFNHISTTLNHPEVFSTYERDPNLFNGNVSYSLEGNKSMVIATYDAGGTLGVLWLVQQQEQRSKIKK